MGANRLLVMDGESEVRAFVAGVARDVGFEVSEVGDPARLIGFVNRFSPTVIVLDLQSPSHDGIEVMRSLGETGTAAKVLLTAGLAEEARTTAEQLGKAMGVDVAGSLAKPILLDALEIQLARLKLQEKTLTAQELAEAIESGQLVVHFQPKATMRSPGRWVMQGAEALVRWQHEEHGLLLPNEFLELAEQNGLMSRLTDFVFRAAMEQARVWGAHGLDMEIAINLSAQFLSDLEFPDRLMILVRENNLDPRALTLELNDTASIDDRDLAMEILARLRARNIGLALDDFGTGFSSLTQLYQMPFTELKIDNSVVCEITGNENARAMVEGLVYLAHKLHMRTCAEGVENAATLEALEQMGCDRAQGHYLGAPVRASALESIVEQWNSRVRRSPGSRAV